jgi:hypothetical protein
MWLYGLFVEKDCVFVGVDSNPQVSHNLLQQLFALTSRCLAQNQQQLQVSSTFERKKGIYAVSFRFSKVPPPTSGLKDVPRICEKCVGEWFDVEGRFAASAFRKDVEEVLKGNVMHLQ